MFPYHRLPAFLFLIEFKKPFPSSRNEPFPKTLIEFLLFSSYLH